MSAENFFYKTYLEDWQKPFVQALPLPAKGLLKVLEGLAVNGRPYGHVTWPNGDVLDGAALAMLSNETLERVSDYLRIMERGGVIGTSKAGAYVVDYLVARNETSKKRKKAGKNGAYVTNGKTTEKKGLLRQNPRHVPQPYKSTKPIKDSKKDNPEDPMWWDGKVIKLRKRDYDQMLETYGGSDKQFMEWLSNRDAWMNDQGPQIRRNWFMSTLAAIKKITAEAAE